MIRRIQSFLVVTIALAAWLASSSSASAQSERRGLSLDVFGAEVRSTELDEDFDSESYGLRSGYRFTDTWALEGSLSRLNEDFGVWFGDLSAKAYLVDSKHLEVYGLAGPGFLRVSAFGEHEDRATVHLGLGAEIALGERAYLRPEVRGRWLADELGANDGIVDYSLGLGWRF